MKLSECHFLVDKVTYHGFEVSYVGVGLGEVKAKAISEFPTPKNQHDVRRLVGMAIFFRQFISKFA